MLLFQNAQTFNLEGSLVRLPVYTGVTGEMMHLVADWPGSRHIMHGDDLFQFCTKMLVIIHELWMLKATCT